MYCIWVALASRHSYLPEWCSQRVRPGLASSPSLREVFPLLPGRPVGVHSHGGVRALGAQRQAAAAARSAAFAHVAAADACGRLDGGGGRRCDRDAPGDARRSPFPGGWTAPFRERRPQRRCRRGWRQQGEAKRWRRSRRACRRTGWRVGGNDTVKYSDIVIQT